MFISMENVNDEEILIGDKKIGLGTVIKLNIKTLLWIVGLLYGGLSTIATVAYFNLKKEIIEQRSNILEENEQLKLHITEELKENIDLINDEIKVFNEDIKTIIRDQGDMKGDIKVLLNKTEKLNVTVDRNSNIDERNNQSLDNLNIRR